jgi:predicted Rdx family selenoprotein
MTSCNYFIKTAFLIQEFPTSSTSDTRLVAKLSPETDCVQLIVDAKPGSQE